jgi:hypothetical protein
VYKELNAVLGETDQAVEASNHLAKLCSSEEELLALTNACIGAYATFGDSLPIEGLTEAANETAKTGVLTGQLADALNWAGVHEDDFNAKLAKCNSESERAALITETLVDLYGDVGQKYKETNKDILSSVAAHEELNAAQARFGEAFEPLAAKWYSFLASVVNFAADNLDAIIVFTDEESASLGVMQKTASDALAILQGATNPDNVDAFTEATNQYIADATALITKFEETYSQAFSKVTGWFDPFEKASVTVTTSIGQMIEGMQSQIDFNNQYSANLQYLKEQGLGGLADAFQSYGSEGSAYAKTVADALQKAGGSATEEGQKIIAEFQAISDAQLQSQEELANTLALANGEIESEMQSLTDNYAEKIAELDLSAEAMTNAQNTMESFRNGLTKGIPGVLSKMTELGDKMTKALQASLGTVTVDVQATLNWSPNNTSFPNSKRTDHLNRGEPVTNADGSNGGIVINQYLETVAQTPAELAAATEAYFVQARWAMA